MLDILRGADPDFAETLAATGEPVIRELPDHELWRRRFWDEGPECSRWVPLVSMELGTYASSEF